MLPRAIILVSVSVLALAGTTRTASSQSTPPAHIPSTLAEALDTLESQLSPSSRAYIRDSLSEGMSSVHMSMGLGIRNSWGLWGDSPLALYFHSIGVHHPDDMSSIILTSFWRRIHGIPIDLDGQVQQAQRYWRFAIPPDSTVIPACPVGVRLFGGTTAPDGPVWITTHVGQCPTTKTWWTYKADRGWAPADSSEFSEFLEEKGVVR